MWPSDGFIARLSGPGQGLAPASDRFYFAGKAADNDLPYKCATQQC